MTRRCHLALLAAPVVVGLLTFPHPARAEPQTLKLAGIAPEGTAWARELKAFAREVATATDGQVLVKWYLGGIAGNDIEQGDRVRRGQLDGVASAGMLCQKVLPSLGVMRIQGLFQNRDEALFVINALTPTLVTEARAQGLEFLGSAALGSDLMFLRAPVSSMAELKKLRLWRWDLDTTGITSSRALGLQIVSTPVEEAAKAFEQNRIDGFISIPSAMLGFQWYTQAHHLLDLRLGVLPGCFLMSARALDRLSIEQQKQVRNTAAKLSIRFTEVTRAQDDALLGGVFGKQGMTSIHISESFRSEFFHALRQVRDAAAESIAPALLQRVTAMLADYRAEHRNR